MFLGSCKCSLSLSAHRHSSFYYILLFYILLIVSVSTNKIYTANEKEFSFFGSHCRWVKTQGRIKRDTMHSPYRAVTALVKIKVQKQNVRDLTYCDVALCYDEEKIQRNIHQTYNTFDDAFWYYYLADHMTFLCMSLWGINRLFLRLSNKTLKLESNSSRRNFGSFRLVEIESIKV